MMKGFVYYDNNVNVSPAGLKLQQKLQFPRKLFPKHVKVLNRYLTNFSPLLCSGLSRVGLFLGLPARSRLLCPQPSAVD